MINNKKSKILIGCLALLLVLSVGYAYFSQNITINGTATAKGEFSIGTTCATGFDSKLGTASDFGVNEQGYKNDSCTVTDNKVKINTELAYPGAIRYFTIKMTNNGTIDATINTDATYGGDITITGKICGTFDEDAEEINEATDCSDDLRNPFAGYLSVLTPTELVAFEKKDGTFINMLTGDENADYSYFLNSDTNILTIKPGESVYWIMAGSVDENISGTKMLMKTDLTIDFKWNQRVN